MTETIEEYRSPHDPQEFGGAIMALETNPYLQRIAEIDAAIDPEHTLPHVELIQNPDSFAPNEGSNYIVRNLIVVHDGQRIGDCVIQGSARKRMLSFNGVKVDEAHRGKGFGLATYKAAIEMAAAQGFGFRTQDFTQTAAAKRVWERLAARGVAREIEPFVPIGNEKFIGHYVVDPVE